MKARVYCWLGKNHLGQWCSVCWELLLCCCCQHRDPSATDAAGTTERWHCSSSKRHTHGVAEGLEINLIAINGWHESIDGVLTFVGAVGCVV